MKKQKRKNTSGRPEPQVESAVKTVVPAKVVVERVKEIAGPLCESQGLELVHVEYHHEPRGLILRIYIDKPGGVQLDDCVQVSRELGDALDIYLETGKAYNLEVSSPGSDRPLSKESDYIRFKGRTAMLKTVKALDGQKNFKGVLLGIKDGNVQMEIDNRIASIPLQDITKGRLVNYNGDNRC